MYEKIILIINIDFNSVLNLLKFYSNQLKKINKIFKIFVNY